MVKPASYKILWDRKALDHFKEALAYLQKQSDQATEIVMVANLYRINKFKHSISIMTTLAIQKRIISKLKETKDKSLLESIYKLLNSSRSG